MARMRRTMLGVVVSAVMLVSTVPAANAATATSLLVPASTAFSVLGHSCGGIQEQAVATAFDATTGYPTGDVYLQTRCGGSGRGGGYHTTTYSAWVGVIWNFTGSVRSSVKLSTAPTNLSPTFSAFDAHGDHLYNALTAVNVLPANCTVGNTTYCTYRAYLTVPVPTAPTAVHVSQAGDALVVSWTASTGPITAGTVTATPTSGGTTLTATAKAPATSVSIGGVAPSTQYSITVTSTNAGGTSPASTPVVFTTQAATIPPSAPTGVVVSWSPDGSVLQARWTAAVPGNSPVNDYQVQIAEYDPVVGTPVVIDAGTSTAITMTGFDNSVDWSARVRAHNTAGWGPWSNQVVLPAF